MKARTIAWHVVRTLAAIPLGLLAALVGGNAIVQALGNRFCNDPDGYCLIIFPGLLSGLAIYLAVGALSAWFGDSRSQRSLLFGGYVCVSVALPYLVDLNSIWHSLDL